MYIKRTRIAEELLATEVHYVSGVKQIVQLFLLPMREKGGTFISSDELKILFGDCEIILAANEQLLQVAVLVSLLSLCF